MFVGVTHATPSRTELEGDTTFELSPLFDLMQSRTYASHHAPHDELRR
jgi:hypothetical protein